MSCSLREGRIEAGGLQFAYLQAGEDGELALCLHGFPDSAHTWDLLLPALAERGYFAVAPWLRGYAPTAIPQDGRYQGAALVGDAIALHDALTGDRKAVIIGHDWGAYVAYGAAAYAPERWRRVVTLAAPPLALAAPRILSYDQLRRSWYQFFFQHPIAEKVLARDDQAFIDRLWSDWSPGLDATDIIEHAKAALRAKDNLSAALGYYRALWDPSRHAPDLKEMQAALLQPTPQPTLYLHGDRDGCFTAEAGVGAEDYLGLNSRRTIIEKAGHFLHLEQAQRVNQEILTFIDEHD